MITFVNRFGRFEKGKDDCFCIAALASKHGSALLLRKLVAKESPKSFGHLFGSHNEPKRPLVSLLCLAPERAGAREVC